MSTINKKKNLNDKILKKTGHTDIRDYFEKSIMKQEKRKKHIDQTRSLYNAHQ